MNVKCTWNEKLILTADAGPHSVKMDVKPPLGTDVAMNPKELVLAGLCGCTAMDVISLLKKYKQPLEGFEIGAEAVMTENGHPIRFQEIFMKFSLRGSIEPSKAIEAITLSQTRYCGVSAMLSRAGPISYTVELNGEVIGTGKANFTG